MVVTAAGLLLAGPLRPQSRRFAGQFAGLVIAALLLSPHLFTYDLTVLLLPASLLAGLTLERRERAAAAPRWTLLLIAALYVMPAASVGIAAACGFQATVPTMIALLCVVVMQYGRLRAVAGTAAVPLPRRPAREAAVG